MNPIAMNELEDIEFNEIDLEALNDIPTTPKSVQKAVEEAPEQHELITLEASLELNDDTITQEQINEMKMLGIPRPPGVSSMRWVAVQNCRIEHDHMIHLLAMGKTQTEIAKELGYTSTQVSIVLNSPEVKAKAQKIMNELYGDAKAALKARSMKVVQKYDELLESPTTKESTIVAIGNYILDHSIGKAQQTIEHKGSVLVDLITKIDQLQNVKDVSPLLTADKDEVDTLIDKVIPDSLVVGKRKDIDEEET